MFPRPAGYACIDFFTINMIQPILLKTLWKTHLMPVNISVIAQVLTVGEVEIVGDWLDFMGIPVEELVLYIGPDPELRIALERFSREREVTLKVVGVAPKEVLFTEESRILRELFAAAASQYALLFKLDSFPYREGNENWLAETINELKTSGALYFTACALPYRVDTQGTKPFLHTKRISNNCLIIRPSDWRSILTPMWTNEVKYGRYASEGLFEDYCAAEGAFGLRRINTPEWRIFHTNVWGQRGQKVRADFKAGRNIDKFMRGFQEDIPLYPWQRYYGFPRPPLSRRARIALGRWRRNLLAVFSR